MYETVYLQCTAIYTYRNVIICIYAAQVDNAMSAMSGNFRSTINDTHIMPK